MDTEGYVAGRYPVIYVGTWSATYKAAEAGDSEAIIKLAGIIAHERAHLDRGPGERQAYDAEIAMLRRCGAPPPLVEGVRRAMRAQAERVENTRRKDLP